MKFFKTLGLGAVFALIILLFFWLQAPGFGFLSGVPKLLGIVGASVMVIISIVVGAILHFRKTPTNNLPNWTIYPLITVIILILVWIFFQSGLHETILGRP